MVSDANATFTDDMHANCLQFFYLVYGDVLTVDEAIAGICGKKVGAFAHCLSGKSGFSLCGWADERAASLICADR